MPAANFTRIQPLPAPKVVATAEVNPGGAHLVRNLVDGDGATEYASAGKGLETFAEFDFGSTVSLAGFRHQENSRGGTVAASELVCFDEQGHETARVPVIHVGRRSAVTMQPIMPAVSARRVRWQVTKLSDARVTIVGAAELTFFRPSGVEASPTGLTAEATALPVADRTPGGSRQPIKLTVDYPYAEPCDVTVQLGATPPKPARLVAGVQRLEWMMPIANREQKLPVVITDAQQQVLLRREFSVPAFRELTIYIVPHSHVDIGYTEIQTDIEEKQVNNILAGIAAADRTANYPEGARFVWNLENLWPADLFLRRFGPQQRELFLQAVKDGRIGLNGMYFNILTGLCRPEELIRTFRFAPEMRAMTGAPLDSAMISDVPGYTWGTVSAMAQAGIRYFSVAPNFFDRIGDILVQWENKPFWWVGPSGRERVLVWVPSRGYYLAALLGVKLTPEWLMNYTEELVRLGHKYDVSYLRWACGGDNSAPNTSICDNVKAWNETYAWPRLVISTVHEAFASLEKKHGAQLPEVKGDWSPYWEDGAGSSALETAMNRTSSDRLAQAEALWTMLQPRSYPVRDFTDAMRYLLLYDEHTWGAARSVNTPNHRTTLEQWPIKHSYAATADALTRDLMSRALALAISGEAKDACIDIYNTSSWARTGLALLPKDFSRGGDRVTDDRGQPVASQRNSYGELLILARDVPALGARRYTVGAGQPHIEEKVVVEGTTLDNGRIKVRLDPQTGDIVELYVHGIKKNFAPSAKGEALNQYLYFTDEDAAKAVSSGPAKINVKEKGPLVASLLVESTAPGCHSFVREVRLVAGEDRVEIENFVDKQRIAGVNYHATGSKESLNFAFPFNVPGGQVRFDVPFGIVRPDADQIPSACKNWLTINRWADVANADYGITWISLDVPLLQLGGLTANLLNSQTNPAVWRKQIGQTQKLYAWVMNNHWGTNYRAYQEGPHTFRFVLRPHGPYEPTATSRAAIEASQPLLPVRAFGPRAPQGSRLQLSANEVMVIGLKPSDDGRAAIVRLWNAAEKDVTTRLQWSEPAPRRVSLSDTSEQPLSDAADSIVVPARGIVTLRAELL
ncbi:MAG: hypothetical protein HZA31_02735 [Opitutae bacterium]|nr:hypothetical protein [Opitutae bacterium]